MLLWMGILRVWIESGRIASSIESIWPVEVCRSKGDCGGVPDFDVEVSGLR